MKMVFKVFGCLMPMVFAFLCQLVVSAIGMTAYAVYNVVLAVGENMNGSAGEDAFNYDNLAENVMERMMNADVIMIIGGAAVAATLLLGALWYKKLRPAEHLPLKKAVSAPMLGGMILLGIALQLLVSMCLNAVFAILPEQVMNEYAELMNSLIGGNIILSLVVTVILAPLAEECLFRGVTLQKAQKIMPFSAANVLQALCFGIYHGNLIQGVYAFFLGLVFGWMVKRFHSIWAAILLRACVNGAAQLLSFVPESVTATMYGIALLVAAGLVLLFVSDRLLDKAETILPLVEEKPEEEKFSENSFD